MSDLAGGKREKRSHCEHAYCSMSDAMIMQYTGFESRRRGREYAFQVRFAAEDVRDFKLTISVEAFDARRARFQDAPDICSLRLRRELTANADCLSDTNFLITDNELDDYARGTTRSPESAPDRPAENTPAPPFVTHLTRKQALEIPSAIAFEGGILGA